jgi:hypothetical protein
MKKILFLMLFLVGCSVSNKLAHKPFVIIEKVYVYTEKDVAEYKFKDARGKLFMFYDDVKWYEVGDTIR